MVKTFVQTKATDKTMHQKDIELQNEDNERKTLIFE